MIPGSDSEKVEIFVSCRKLKNMDFFSKSDPEVRLYTQSQGKWIFHSKTEMIKDNLNPNFKTTFLVDFIFEVNQPIKLECVDIDGPNKWDLIGVAETTVGKLMGTKNQTQILDLKDNKSKFGGKLILRAEKTGNSKNELYMEWCGVKLMNTDGWFGKSDPFLRFLKLRDGGEYLKIHETEVVMDNLNPKWKPIKLKDDRLCSGDHSRKFRIECWDWEKSLKFQYIGHCELTLDEIKRGTREWELHHPKKKKKTGTLKLNNFQIKETPGFIDFIRGGTQLSVVTAVDFTGSNGHPNSPSSLHYRNPNQLNQYQQAIQAVGQILLNYDWDQKVPVFGFGGKPHFPNMNQFQVNHCFPCSGNPSDSEVLGLQGIMNIYEYALNNVELSGPTFFAPLIAETMKMCEYHKNSESDVYTILLILTDGEIHDMDKTIDLIVKSSHLPLSIIIVGIGNADFGKMDTLDGDNGLFNSAGQKAMRDLVQFVPYRNFKGDMSRLAKEVLAEVPDQLCEYMRLVGKKPRPATDINIAQLGMQQQNDGNQGGNGGGGFQRLTTLNQQLQDIPIDPNSQNVQINVNTGGAQQQQQQPQGGFSGMNNQMLQGVGNFLMQGGNNNNQNQNAQLNSFSGGNQQQQNTFQKQQTYDPNQQQQYGGNQQQQFQQNTFQKQTTYDPNQQQQYGGNQQQQYPQQNIGFSNQMMQGIGGALFGNNGQNYQNYQNYSNQQQQQQQYPQQQGYNQQGGYNQQQQQPFDMNQVNMSQSVQFNPNQQQQFGNNQNQYQGGGGGY